MTDLSSIWGDIPSWLSAIGTVGSLLAAVWLLKEDLEDRRSMRKASEEQNARRVSCWCDANEENATLWAQNLSEEPIYDAVCYIGNSGTDLNSLPDEENRYMEVVFGVMPPQQKINYKIDDSSFFKGSQFPDLPNTAIEFTDAQGIHWHRYQDGKLKRIPHRRPFD